MKITLTQDEIEESIRQYVGAQLHVRDGKRIEIDLRATRGDAGYTAEIEIVDCDTEPGPKSEEPVKLKTASKAEPIKVSAADVAADEDTPPFEVETKADAEDADVGKNSDAEPSEDDAPKANSRKSIFADVKRPVNA